MKENSNLKAIFALPKWAKIFLAVLSVVAVAGLITAFSLKAWAADKVESGQLVLNGIDKGMQERLDSGFAFDGRLYFARLDFLLRSKVIAYIDIQGISWGENIDKNAISDISSHNRHIKFITSQDLQGLNAQNIGKVEYKMDFSPLFKTIIKYYLIISLGLLVVLFLRNFLWLSERGEISFATQTSLPSVLWQGYKSINPLYRHTFWIVFIAMNLVFGFHTVQFLWGNHDWNMIFGQTSGWMLNAGNEGRYLQYVISHPLQMFMVLPLLNNILTFFALALAAVWLCIYLNIPQRLYVWILIGLVLTLSPLVFERMYFAHQVAGCFIGFAFCMVGFILAKKAGEFSPVCKGGGGQLAHFAEFK